MKETTTPPTPLFPLELDITDGDEDGFLIKEQVGENMIYVYYSELDILLQKLKKKRHEWLKEKRLDQHSSSSKTAIQNTLSPYKYSVFFKDFPQYKRYIKSKEWQQKKNERLKKDQQVCKHCGSTRNLEVHHKTYKNFGRESIDDLITLCRDCHEKMHGAD